jgi:eukaryotic-like serine/threonine-protein kinase
MAETFLAVQRRAAGFEQRVCVKFILPAYRDNADFRRLFLREASIGASLRHSNIVGVIDVDEAAGYLVLELVDGVDLRALLTASPNHRLAPELAILVTIELCKALAYAHGRKRRGQPDGIVHRDISPSNVLISYAGEIKLTDFGVARAMRSDAEPLSTTIKGKLCYMSPEQARGQLLDGRSDLFSLGVVCYELLSGRRPFDGQTDAETLLRVTAGQHTPLLELAPDVPPGLALAVERLLCRDREQRFSSADACIDALARFSPRATSFRELGELARAARPHETVAFTLEDDLAEQSGPALQSTLTATQGLMPTLPPRTSPVASIQPEVPSQTSVGGALQRVHRNAWVALGLSVVLLLGVGSAWLTRLSADQPSASEPTQSIPTRPPVVGGQLGDAPQPAPTTPVVQPQPAPPVIQPATDNRRLHEPPPSDTPAPSPAVREHLEPATLTVGTVPWAQVWIDDRPYGWPPTKVSLKPGVHRVAAGQTRPGKRHAVKLKSGESKQMVINLDRDESSSVDTTSDAADR